MQDALGDRMKGFYEDRYRIKLARRAYTIIRVDGKAFHTYTRGLERPFDKPLVDDMNETACYLCKNIMGAKFAYVQSDEISILITDFDDLNTEAWFDGNLQKMCSVSASMATSAFNTYRIVRSLVGNAMFDSRVFQIPAKVEVENYFIWRQQDATRNSIQSAAQSLYSDKELQNKNTDQQQEMMFQKGVNWNDYPIGMKRGRVIVKEMYQLEGGADRSRWIPIEPPIFTQDRDFLTSKIP